MVEVEIGGMRAIAEGLAWTKGDPDLLALLQQDLQIRASTGYDPFPALTIAQEAVALYGGRIVRQEPPNYVPGTIY